MKAQDIINLAIEELGYIGKRTDEQLDDKTANIVGKFTKYARDLYDAEYYGGYNKNGFDWCCVFVDWLFYVAAGRNKEEALKVKPSGLYSAGVYWAYKDYADLGRISPIPAVGAQIFYRDNSMDLCHTGLVINVTDTTVRTIEGNWNDRVGGREIPRDSQEIAGYGIPSYSEADEFHIGDEVRLKDGAKYYINGAVIPEWVRTWIPLYVRNIDGDRITISTIPEGDITGIVWAYDLEPLSVDPPKEDAIITFPTLEEGEGAPEWAIWILQALLDSAGFACNGGRIPLDGVYSPATIYAVNEYKDSVGLEANGIVDGETWERLITNYGKEFMLC